MTLDHLSGGRFVLGVGMGDVNDASFAGLGEVTDVKRRARLLDEGLDVVSGLVPAGSLSTMTAWSFTPRN